MKKITLAIISVCVLAGLAYTASALSDNNKRYNWRYKMTVEIDTPEGVKSGSAVRQMGDNYKVTFPVEATNYGEVLGEAVVVDISFDGDIHGYG
tara:strand:- start:385 stop:666 length:282 start_codon:yes stop_codon:yes gene_type:complete